MPKGRENSFGFNYGPVHYFCADNVNKGLNDKVQLELIIADAGASDAKWKFVSYHVPSVNFSGHWSAWGYPYALPGLSEAGVDFVLAGHSHLYERFRPDRTDLLILLRSSFKLRGWDLFFPALDSGFL